MTQRDGGYVRGVPFMNQAVDEDDVRAVSRVLRRGQFGPGRGVKRFEEELSAYFGRPCVLTSSGTMALALSALAAGLELGDEIIVPAYGVPAVPNAFDFIGLSVVFADIDKATGCLTIEEVERVYTEGWTKAVCFVDFSGNCPSVCSELREWCTERGLVVIEDAACALGSYTPDGTRAGKIGHYATLSFSTPKIVTCGQGGAVLCPNEGAATTVRAMINHARGAPGYVGPRTNLRMTDLQAALGLSMFQRLSHLLARREQIHDRLCERLPVWRGVSSAPLHNVLFVDPSYRRQFQTNLKERHVHAWLQYNVLSSLARYREHHCGPTVNSQWWAQHALWLPFGTGMSDEDVDRVITACLEMEKWIVPLGEQHEDQDRL